MNTKTVLITGASRGLGAASARIAAGLGANVVLNARSRDELEVLAREIRENGGNAVVAAGDISQLENCQRAVATALEQFGELDALINNAGVLEPISPFAEADPHEWERNLRINILGLVWVTQAATPHLRQNHGRVIHVSSGAAVNVVKGWSAYCTAKAALNHFNRSLAVEEPYITTIALRPGVVDTEMQALIRQDGKTGMPDDVHKRFVQYHDRGELLPPEKPGRAMAVLALYAPHEWSGEYIQWDEDRVQRLIERV